MTSLDMAGANFSILKVDEAALKLLDAPFDFPGWPRLTQPGGKILPKSSINTADTTKIDKVNVPHCIAGSRVAAKFYCVLFISFTEEGS